MNQPSIAIEELSFSIGDFHLNKLNASLANGEILVILGPNGSGKSVTLETIAGFHRPDAGRILIGGRDVTRLSPERRNIAFLLQNFALFPHLTVEQNVAIALRAGRVEQAGHETPLPYGNVAKLLDYFGITQLGRRMPQALSPGEKQRVAFARALAAQPDLFLFDEPFSALDTQTRDQLRDDLLSLLRQMSLPAIFVTHDYTDAMILADKTIVLNEGKVAQAGIIDDILYRPADSFVAHFTGTENILAGQLARMNGNFVTVFIGGQALRARRPSGDIGSTVQVCIRADAVTLLNPADRADQEETCNRLAARVVAQRRLGPLEMVKLDGGFPINVYVSSQQSRAMNLSVGLSVNVEIPPESIHLIEH